MCALQEIRGTPHFTNLHSWTGLATLALATLTPIGGALAFGKTGLLQLFPKGLQPVVKTAHRNVSFFSSLTMLPLSSQAHLLSSYS